MKNLRHLFAVKPGDRPRLMELSAERDMWLQRLLAAWAEGFFFGAKSRSGDYEAGFADGIMAYKAAQHDAHRLLELEQARWQGWREDFGQPRDGDYEGRQQDP